MSRESKLIIIGGGSSNGKSKIIKELGRRGYELYDEPARAFLEQRKLEQGDEKYSSPDYEENVYRQTEIYKRVIAQEGAVLENPGVHFLERSGIEAFAFNEHLLGKRLPITKELPPTKLDLVFIPAKLNFQPDGTRIEKSEKEAQAIHDTVIRTYFEEGYRPYMIPIMPGETKQEQIEMRTDYVMKISAQEGLLEDIYKFNRNSDVDFRLKHYGQINQKPSKIHDLLYAQLRKKSSEKVYNPKQLGEIINELSPEENFDSYSVNSILSCLERDRILTNLWGRR